MGNLDKKKERKADTPPLRSVELPTIHILSFIHSLKYSLYINWYTILYNNRKKITTIK